MSNLLSHKSIRVKKPTRGHAPNSAGEDVRPSDTLIDRCQQWKHTTKSLLHYYQGLANIESATSKSTLALMDTIQVPFHEGHQFLGEGGWQAVLYEVRDNTKVLADHHSALALTLEKTVVKELEGVRSELKAHILAIEKEAGVIADEVEKERSVSATHLAQLQEGINTFENSSVHMLPQHDPYVTHTQVLKQLSQQVHKENELQSALIRFQQQQPSFEAGISNSIQSACKLYDEAKALKLKEIAVVEKQISEALQRVADDAEYNFYASKPNAVIDPNTPYRTVEAVTFPGLNHSSTKSIKEGHLERKKRFTKSYKEGYYVLTPSGYLHERKSNDDTNNLVPTFSLFLPECSLSAPAKESDKSHKFRVEGNKAVRSSFESKIKNTLRFGGKEISYSFRARTHTEMLGWWTPLDTLSRDTKLEAHVAAGSSTSPVSPIAFAVSNVGYAAPPEPTPATPEVVEAEHVEEDDDEDEEGGSSAEEEDDERFQAITAPSTPAVGEVMTSPLDITQAEAQSPAEVLPTYSGDGNAAAEKAALQEKGAAPGIMSYLGFGSPAKEGADKEETPAPATGAASTSA